MRHVYINMEYKCKRGAFVVAGELPDCSHSYISYHKKIPLCGTGPHLAIFNELALAISYVNTLIAKSGNNSVKIDFVATSFFVKEITGQKEWDDIIKLLISDDVKTAVVNPCHEIASNVHNCPIRPFNLETGGVLTFDVLIKEFSDLPCTHVNVIGQDEKIVTFPF